MNETPQPPCTTSRSGTHQRMHFVTTNNGATAHSPQIVGGEVDTQTDNFSPEHSRVLGTQLASGIYPLTCPIPSHVEQRMRTSPTVIGP